MKKGLRDSPKALFRFVVPLVALSLWLVGWFWNFEARRGRLKGLEGPGEFLGSRVRQNAGVPAPRSGERGYNTAARGGSTRVMRRRCRRREHVSRRAFRTGAL